MLKPTLTALALLLASGPALAQTQTPAAATGQTEVLWLGQAAFRITSPGGKVIVIDPWLRTNPKTPAGYKDPAALGRVDAIFVTHGHFDHIAEAPELSRMHNIPVYAPGDLNQVLTTLGVLPAERAPRFNKGGTVQPVAGIKVTAVRAEHSSVYVHRDEAGKSHSHYGGEPVGYILEMETGFKIYHMGDTDAFGDMKLIAERYRPDLVLIPIGGNFTMDPQGAALATRELLKPKYAIPMHYGTNPLNKGTPDEYIAALGRSSTQVIRMEPGQMVKF
jgi:L-ascorbate metabolism protein UlaG (beta-lactamase superfamily)